MEKTAVKKVVKKPVRERKAKIEIIPEEKVPKIKVGKYFEAIGRRKTAIARIRISAGTGVTVNGKTLNEYFPDPLLQGIIHEALSLMDSLDKFAVSAHLSGGGVHSQAEAIRHGISRALILFNADYKKRLKKAGFLTRDPRMRERKKFGLKRARKAPQWAKR
jgi:small subunit ribosomal protein S9